MTVGSGIGPDLLTLKLFPVWKLPRRSRARQWRMAPKTYRRWGIAPRPEDVYWLDLLDGAGRRTGGEF